MHCRSRYDLQMHKPLINTRKVLSDNLKRLMDAHDMKQKPVAEAAKRQGFAIDQTYVGRILNMEVAATIEKVESIAAAFGLQPWQLLVPHLDPNNPPVVHIDPAEQRLYERIKMAAQELAKYETGED